MCAAYNVIGIWKWSPIIDLAKEFLDFHFQQQQQEKGCDRSSSEASCHYQQLDSSWRFDRFDELTIWI